MPGGREAVCSALLLPLLQAVPPHATLPLPLLLPEALGRAERVTCAVVGKGEALTVSVPEGLLLLVKVALAVKVTEGLLLLLR